MAPALSALGVSPLVLCGAALLGVVSLDAAVEDLSENALSVRAQTVSPNDDGRLEWDLLFAEPPEQPDGLELSDIVLSDFRPASDRRELNANGRLIPLARVTQRKAKILPIEGYASIAEDWLGVDAAPLVPDAGSLGRYALLKS